MGNGVIDSLPMVPFKRPLPGQQFIKDHAQRPDVRTMINGFALHLFGRHIIGRAYESARVGQAAGEAELGHAKINNPNPTVITQDGIGRIQVAVDDTLPVRGLQAIGQLAADVERLLQSPAGPREFAPPALCP